MPADCDNALLAMPPHHTLTDFAERNRVETTVPAKFYLTKLKTSHSRIITHSVFCI